MVLPRLALLVLVACLGLTAQAGASFSGSNGKVAWVSDSGALVVDDPFDDVLEPATLAQATVANGNALAPQSPPQWSPDGTRIAFTAAVDNGPLPKHSAVFVVNLDGSGLQQVSTPFIGREDSCPTCKDGETAWDVSPSWKNDSTLAFIRWVAAGDNAAHEDQEGTTVRTVSADGGGETAIRHYPNENKEAALSVIWPSTWSEPIVIHGSAAGYKLLGASSGTVFASALGIPDVDAAPNGQLLAYSSLGPSGQKLITIDKSGQQIDSYSTGFHPAWVRFTPDGNGLLVPGCAKDRAGQNLCGLITHRLPDPEADLHPDEPAEAPFLETDITAIAFPHLPGSRSNYDIQSQDLPMIYVPGFLGSEVLCDQVPVWMPAAPPLNFSKMRMQEDGLSNATCATARPSGKMVDTFIGADVYGHADEWLASMNPAGGWRTFGWDWRKRPQESLAKLDAIVDELVAGDLTKRQGVSRVSLVGHSYGALLIRAYIDEEPRAKKVARVLTVGAPYWGSPKPVFGIAFGIELPGPSAIDVMANNDDMREFVQNVSGAYHLTPSDNYGPWFKLNGQQLDQAATNNWLVTFAQANRGLLEQSQQTHRDMIDGFYDRGGMIDYRSVTGVGLLTIGSLNILQPGRDGDDTITAGVFFEDGDGTVTARSATQGTIADPLGDNVHIQERCGIFHMRQTADKVVQGAYARFLVDGHLPRKLPAPDCPPEGQSIQVFHGLELEPPHGYENRARRGDGPLGLADAAIADRADVMQLPGETLIVTDKSTAVPLTFKLTGQNFAITDLVGDQQGERLEYPATTGTVVVDTTAGERPAVTVDGQPLQPVSGQIEPEPTATASPSPSPQPTPAPTVTPDPESEPQPTACAAKVSKARKALKRAKKAYAAKHTKRNAKKVRKAKKAYKAAAKRCKA